MNRNSANDSHESSGLSDNEPHSQTASRPERVRRARTAPKITFSHVEQEYGAAAAILMKVDGAAKTAIGRILVEVFARIGGSGRDSIFNRWLADFCPELHEQTARRRRDDYEAFSKSGNADQLMEALLRLARQMSDKSVENLSKNWGVQSAAAESSPSLTTSCDPRKKSGINSRRSRCKFAVEVELRAVIQEYLEAGTTEAECLRGLEIVLADLKQNIVDESWYEPERRRNPRR